MDWQANGDWPGGEPGRDADLPALLAAFAHGGSLETALPSAALAMALERAAGPRGTYGDADTDALVGIARQWAAVESWAAAGLMGALRAMMREGSTGAPVLRRRTDLPGGWDDSLNYEIAAALAMGPVSAQHLAGLAWTLGMRLPGIGRLLADGTLTRSKARLVAQLFEPLEESEAARAEALVLGDLPGKTYPQVERLAWRAALAVAPDVAERRRSGAERAARVTVFREDAGTAALCGRDLPAAEALAGHANLVARARVYEASGVFAGESMSRLQAQAYLDLLNGVPAADRIAYAATATADPPDDPGPDDDDGGDDWPGGDGGTDPDDGGPGEPEAPDAPAAPLAEVTVPLATLQGSADRAGDSPLLGPLDPALARQLAAAAARLGALAVGNHHHRRARLRHRARHRPPRARRTTANAPAGPGPDRAARTGHHHHHRDAPPPAHAARRSRDPAHRPAPGNSPRRNQGSWALTLPGGRQLTVRFDVVPTHHCDHRYQTSAYQPGDRLRRLVQIRDHQCTFPTCSRPARESDFEHAVPWDKGGKTDACNAGRPQQTLPSGQAEPRLERHPAQAGLASVDDTDRPDLRPGTLALHRIRPPRAEAGPFD